MNSGIVEDVGEELRRREALMALEKIYLEEVGGFGD
jgi:hypothetical protein